MTETYNRLPLRERLQTLSTTIGFKHNSIWWVWPGDGFYRINNPSLKEEPILHRIFDILEIHPDWQSTGEACQPPHTIYERLTPLQRLQYIESVLLRRVILLNRLPAISTVRLRNTKITYMVTDTVPSGGGAIQMQISLNTFEEDEPKSDAHVAWVNFDIFHENDKTSLLIHEVQADKNTGLATNSYLARRRPEELVKRVRAIAQKDRPQMKDKDLPHSAGFEEVIVKGLFDVAVNAGIVESDSYLNIVDLENNNDAFSNKHKYSKHTFRRIFFPYWAIFHDLPYEKVVRGRRFKGKDVNALPFAKDLTLPQIL